MAFHTHKDGYKRKKKGEKQLLASMWRNWNFHKLLVGMLNGAATVEVWQILKKLNIELSCAPAILFLGILSR